MREKGNLSLEIAGVILLGFFIQGCFVGNYYGGQKVLAERIKDIKPGITTREEIIQWFGPPRNYVSPTVINHLLTQIDITDEPISEYPFANILSYQYDVGRFKALILILFNHVELDVKSDHLVIFFDDDERVKYFGFRKGTEEFK